MILKLKHVKGSFIIQLSNCVIYDYKSEIVQAELSKLLVIYKLSCHITN